MQDCVGEGPGDLRRPRRRQLAEGSLRRRASPAADHSVNILFPRPAEGETLSPRSSTSSRPLWRFLLASGLSALLVLGTTRAAEAKAEAEATEGAQEGGSAPIESEKKPGPQEDGSAASLARDGRELPSMVFRSEDGNAQLRLSLMSQLRFDYRNSEAEDGSRQQEEEFVLQRVRPILMGRFFDDKLRVRLHLNTGPTQIELLDLFADYRFSPQLRLRVGQQKIPLTRHRGNSFARLTLVDWAHVARFFGAERQIGTTLHNDFESKSGLEYEVGIFSGTNARNSFERGPWQVYDIPQGNPSELADPADPARLHPELAGRIGWHTGKDAFESDSDDQASAPRLTTGLSGAWDFRPEAGQDFGGRIAPEVLIKAWGFSASVVGHLGLVERAMDESIALGAFGFLGQLAYRYRFVEAAFRYSRVQVSAAMRRDARAVAAGLSEEESRPRAGELESVDELSSGLNFYVFNHGLKSQLDYVATIQGWEPGDRVDHAVRSLLQLIF